MKEQAPFQYGTHLADEGYAALIFDPGLLESPKMKHEDMLAGLDFLVSRGDIDQSRLFLAGICYGGPQSLDVALYDHQVVGVASVTGYYSDHETDLYMICTGCVSMPTPEQGEALYQARLERPGVEAKRLYDTTGEIIYQPLVDPKAADPTTGSLVGLPGPVVWSWYNPKTLKGFENHYAVMSDLDHFGYSTVSGVSQLKNPALIIHGDNCINAAAAKRHFDSIPTPKKKLIWNNTVSHFQHYDQADCIDRNIRDTVSWFAQVGGTT
ncbi:Alpha/Beta hydrolase protein [Aspergillus novoparasiticus]|uniref:Alpha/Beta hydrolase protein n=1 Tax=Aspergillus novoparasiticus TaxID=986946 RepID=A0A5N6EER3_9EURO|nr:Alpha/Beta hydrolase protein [Aspergillus novoparasiticus]